VADFGKVIPGQIPVYPILVITFLNYPRAILPHSLRSVHSAVPPCMWPCPPNIFHVSAPPFNIHPLHCCIQPRRRASRCLQPPPLPLPRICAATVVFHPPFGRFCPCIVNRLGETLSSSMFDRIFVRCIFTLQSIVFVSRIKGAMPSAVCMRILQGLLLHASFSIETETCSRSYQVRKLVGMVSLYAIILYIFLFIYSENMEPPKRCPSERTHRTKPGVLKPKG
jgi:hypothetical protein